MLYCSKKHILQANIDHYLKHRKDLLKKERFMS